MPFLRHLVATAALLVAASATAALPSQSGRFPQASFAYPKSLPNRATGPAHRPPSPPSTPATVMSADKARRAPQSSDRAPPLRGPAVQPPRPNDCTYWVTPSLLAGEHPTDRSGEDGATRRKLGHYLDRGVTFFLDLTERGEKADYELTVREVARERGKDGGAAVAYRRLPVPDFGIPDEERMRSILDAIDGAVGDGHVVYVHCRGGIGRTGTAVGCYLARHGNEGGEALDEVNRLFRSSGRSLESCRSPETSEQEGFVRGWPRWA